MNSIGQLLAVLVPVFILSAEQSFASSSTAFSETKQRSVCTEDSAYKVFDSAGSLKEEKALNYKISEATRTTWKYGDIEIRFAESISFDVAGDRTAETKSVSKVESSVLSASELIEKSEVNWTSRFLKIPVMDVDGIAKSLISRSTIREDHFVLGQDGQRTLVKSVVDGVVSNKKSVQRETMISPTLKAVKEVREVPYTEVFGESMIVYTKFEIYCQIELIN